ncbi:MAG TPA: SPASM domain-containing protein [Candidatus Methanoperedens sp.]
MYLTKRIKIMPAQPGYYYVCNAITGEIMLLSEAGLQAFELLRQNVVLTHHQELIKVLRQKSFLFDSQEEEKRAFDQICKSSWDAFQNHSPNHYTFIVNTQCNFNCPYCFEAKSARRVSMTLSMDQIDSAFDIIDHQTSEDSQQEEAGIEIFGGEPLLPTSKAFVEYIFKNMASRNLTASIQTNGYYLLEYLDLISQYSGFINQIQITLDGPPHIHNQRRVLWGGEPTFDRLIAGIGEFLQMDLPIQLNLRTNVDLENIDFLEELIEFYERNGWVHHPRVNFIAAPVDNRCGNLTSVSKLLSWHTMFERIFPISKDNGGLFDLSVFKAVTYFRNYFSVLARGNQASQPFIPKVVYCEAAALKLFIFHPDGRIYPCPESVSMHDLAIGTYFPDFHLHSEKTLPWQNPTILQRERCPSCEVSTFCGGGCILTALLENGSMRQPVCEDTPEIIAAYFNNITNSI